MKIEAIREEVMALREHLEDRDLTRIEQGEVLACAMASLIATVSKDGAARARLVNGAAEIMAAQLFGGVVEPELMTATAETHGSHPTQQ